MDTLIFSQTAIFRMQQLASCLYHKTGVRYRMASQEGMLELLRQGGASRDAEVREYYDAFILELNKRQLDMLEARNVKLRKPFSNGIGSATPSMTGTLTSGVRKTG
jgi:hypothetical protein